MSGGDWDVDSQTLTIPPFAGPGQPRLVLGPDIPAELEAKYPGIISGAILFYNSSGAYHYKAVLDTSHMYAEGVAIFAGTWHVMELLRQQPVISFTDIPVETYGVLNSAAVVYDGAPGFAPSVTFTAGARLIIQNEEQLTDWNSADWTASWTNTGTANTLGNGSISSRYHKFGKTWTLNLRLTWGASTAAGTGQWGFTLPFTPNTDDAALTGFVKDNSTGLIYPVVGRVRTAGTIDGIWLPPSTVIAGGGTPFVFAADDRLTLTGTIEEA